MNDYASIASQITIWLANEVKKAGASGLIIGISGGIDSALVGALAKKAFPDNCLGVIMPCDSDPADIVDAKFVAEHLQLPYVVVDLAGPYAQLVQELTKGIGKAPQGLALNNIKPRLRMITLYSLAATHNYLVAGTGNRSEAYIGYFTKYGDGGTDLWPIVGLVKGQVRGLADFLGVPEKIVNREPSAGLWPGQTDEKEMGLTYEELDRYLLTKEGPEAVKSKIEILHNKSAHKRALPPSPEIKWE